MAHATTSNKGEELQHQLQTLNVLESELKSLKPDAKVYNAIPTSLEAPVISHAHAQKALFPNLDVKTALEDVQIVPVIGIDSAFALAGQRKVLLANLQQLAN